MKILKLFGFLGVLSLGTQISACGMNHKMEASSQLQSSQLEELRAKQEQFRTQSGSRSGCGSSLLIRECIAGVDKLLALSLTDVFPTTKFDSVYLTEEFDDVSTSGSVWVNAFATTETIKEHFIQQTNDLPVMKEKQRLFAEQSLNRVGCGMSLSMRQCLAGLDKLLTLSTTSLFPTSNFDSIYLTDTFANVRSNGSVWIDFFATADEMRAHLANQSLR